MVHFAVMASRAALLGLATVWILATQLIYVEKIPPLQHKSYSLLATPSRLSIERGQPGKARKGHAINSNAKEPLVREAFVPLLGKKATLPLPVVLYPYAFLGSTGEQAYQLAENGIRESPFMELSNDIYNFDSNVVWVADESAGGWPMQPWCETLAFAVRHVQEKRRSQSLPERWPIHMLQVFTDQPWLTRCELVEDLVGVENVRYYKRSVVENRSWNSTKNWVDLGEVFHHDMMQHANIAVRTDIVEGISNILRKRSMSLSDPVEQLLDRPIDAAVFWPSKRQSGQVLEVFDSLRFRVSWFLDLMGNSSLYRDQKAPNIYTGIQGLAAAKGRSTVSRRYIRTMMATKIHVVTQRDNWEDHYRLFEAMVSGALVMTDPMLTLPAGLEDGKSVIVYTSLKDLRAKITYYLQHPAERIAIAKRGREIAMTRHRSWQRMEEVVFGRALSSFTESSKWPWIVHTDELDYQ